MMLIQLRHLTVFLSCDIPYLFKSNFCNLAYIKNQHFFSWQPWSRDHMNNPLGWFYSMKELWSMGMISILEIFKSTPVKTSHFSSSDAEAAPICFCFSQSLWVSEINQGSLLRHRMKDRQHIRKYHPPDTMGGSDSRILFPRSSLHPV